MDAKRRCTRKTLLAISRADIDDEADKENAPPQRATRSASRIANYVAEQTKRNEKVPTNIPLGHGIRSINRTLSSLTEDGEEEDDQQIRVFRKYFESEKESWFPRLSFDNVYRTPGSEISEEVNGDTEQEISDDESDSSIPEDVYVVESILAESNQVGELMYLLKWKGYDYNESTWASEDELMNCHGLLKEHDVRKKIMAQICTFQQGSKASLSYQNAWMSYAFYPCRKWEDDVNRLISPHGHAKIYVENWVNNDAPNNFTYGIKHRVSDKALKLLEAKTEEYMLCECHGNCDENKDCVCNENGAPYTKQGQLTRRCRGVSQIVECSERCGCSEDCPLRTVQRGRKFPIVLFRTLHKGWSIRAAVDIPSGSFVAEYIGGVITTKEANATTSAEYQFQLEGKNRDRLLVIDAQFYGNEARFVNHSCKPNLDVYNVFVKGEYENLERIAFFTSRAVKKGEELTIKYYTDEQYKEVRKAERKKKRKCLCRAKKCPGFMP
ncbi:SET domain-containing protein [Ditylenchus destructor]|uniref:SET domain-containing protein n=1 Tax=Ditylenchus destructor TaxID=166010 RepID=A0AAD4N0R3_9BILA|nr:SET domain-containing protein [Ditylenchus destructor]